MAIALTILQADPQSSAITALALTATLFTFSSIAGLSAHGPVA